MQFPFAPPCFQLYEAVWFKNSKAFWRYAGVPKISLVSLVDHVMVKYWAKAALRKEFCGFLMSKKCLTSCLLVLLVTGKLIGLYSYLNS